MNSQHLDETQRGPGWALSGLGVALIVGLGLVAVEVISRWLSTAPPNPPQVEPALWAPERLGQNSPLPVRIEPAGRPALVLPMVLGSDARWDPSEALWEPFEFGDGLADGVPSDMPWLDIREVQHSLGGRSGFRVVLAGPPPSPLPAPVDAWISYGVVFDTDGDGRADTRIGTDNTAGNNHRSWWADLRTGEVTWGAGPNYGSIGGGGEGRGGGRRIELDTWFPGEGESAASNAFLEYEPTELEFRLYTWAALIHDGRVVSMDFAPDVAWLEPGTPPVLTFAGPVWWHERVMKIDGGSYSIVQTLTVDQDGRLNINTACHAGTADILIDETTVRVSDVAVEETADCRSRGPETEKELLKILSAGTITYTIEDGVLELRAGARAVRFRAVFQGPFR